MASGDRAKPDVDGLPIYDNSAIAKMAPDLSIKKSLLPHSRLNPQSQLQRCNSLGSSSQLKKRKLLDTSIDSTNTDPVKVVENPIAFNLIEALQMNIKYIQELTRTVEENTNTKREIKSLVDKLKRTVEIFKRDSTKEWLETHRFDKAEPQMFDVDIQVNIKTREQKDISTQTVAWTRGGNPIINSLEGINTLEDFKKVENFQWTKEIYTKSEIKVGNPLNTRDDVTKVVLVEPENKRMQNGIANLYCTTFPELAQIDEDFAVVEQSTTIKTKNNKEPIKKKIIKAVYKRDDDDIWNVLQKVRHEVTGINWIALHHVDFMTVERLRKMTEVIFQNSETQVVIYTTNQKLTDQPNLNKKRQERERMTYALVVEDGDSDYKSILNKTKTAIQGSSASGIVKSLRSTQEGKLLIITDKDKEAIVKLKEAITQNTDSMKVRKIGREAKLEAIHIRGIDATTSKEEIRAAIEAKLGSTKKGQYTLGELRPNARNTMAVTLTVCREDAEKIIENKEIQIGLVRCSVEKRIALNRCFKCWSFDHQTTECKGPDRSRLCFKCGQEGHKGSECKNGKECPLCETSGHAAGSGQCNAFKRALSSARKLIRARQTGPMSQQSYSQTMESTKNG